MRIKMPYSDIPPLEVPDQNLMGYYYPKREPDAEPPREAVSRALANPIGAVRLAEAVRPGQKVLLLVDDITRPTPQHQLLPPVIEELHRGGIRDEDLRVLIAYGSHRAMAPVEKRLKLGSTVITRHEVLDHDWESKTDLADLGKLEDGTPVVVNRHLVESDFVLSVGHIVPHRAQGFTGGGKMVLPGVSGRASLNAMHWKEAQYTTGEILGRADNPVRQTSDEFARRAGLKYVVNVVLDDEDRVVGAWAGDPVRAHREGCRKSLDVYGIAIPEPADICVIDSYPADIDLWQANKAIFAADAAVKQGGVLILVTPAPEGAARTHPRLAKIGFRPHQEIARMVEEGQIEAGASAAALSDVGRVIKEKATGIMVSPGIKPAVQKQLGFQPAKTPQEALKMAFDRKGRDAKVVVFHHGGEIVPLPQRNGTRD